MKDPKLVEHKNYYSFEFPNGFTYDIPKEMIVTRQQFVDWYCHLDGKIWFNNKIALEFALKFIMQD